MRHTISHFDCIRNFYFVVSTFVNEFPKLFSLLQKSCVQSEEVNETQPWLQFFVVAAELLRIASDWQRQQQQQSLWNIAMLNENCIIENVRMRRQSVVWHTAGICTIRPRSGGRRKCVSGHFASDASNCHRLSFADAALPKNSSVPEWWLWASENQWQQTTRNRPPSLHHYHTILYNSNSTIT